MAHLWETVVGMHERLVQMCDGSRPYSSRDIAKILSREFGVTVTRNSVVSRTFRRGLKLPRATEPPTEKQKASRDVKARARRTARDKTNRRSGTIIFGPASQKLPPMELPIQADSIIPHSQRRTLMELNEKTCRWPVGDPRSPDFYYCGGLVVEGCPYCLGHARIAYQPAEARRRSAVPAQMREAAE